VAHAYVRVMALVLTGAAAASGCGSDAADSSDGAGASSNGQGGAPSETADCAARCQAKLGDCGASDGDASAACAQYCASDRSEAEVACLESSDCATLAHQLPDCDTGQGGAGASGPTGGGSDETGGGGEGGQPPLGPNCQALLACCQDAEYPPGDVAICTSYAEAGNEDQCNTVLSVSLDEGLCGG
jgi:hypothetical protein